MRLGRYRVRPADVRHIPMIKNAVLIEAGAPEAADVVRLDDRSGRSGLILVAT